ncbi:conserved hypothetical protein [Lebetimonas natsushimae]|uniref:Uncharacterized protein n=1 Tax=Lebetimonas natsushimae TaxID=1936991 RepID=A0A292YF90_9BACT|nr:hypothetical protein [Lebetimonas natsushimae]GAX88138.1 conserved hypothetical protein [Lebetimonas natsushimae]
MSLVDKYKKLDELVVKDKEEEVNDTFKEILEETFKKINKKIEEQKTLDIKNPEEKMAVRAMMEYMLELWDEGATDEAKQVGYDMVYLVDDARLKEMFTLFVIGILAGLSLDKFFEKYIDLREIYEDYFFTGFNDEIDELVEKYKDQFVKEFQE